MTRTRRGVLALLAMLAVAFLPNEAWGADCATDPSSCATASPSADASSSTSSSPDPSPTSSADPTPTATATETVTAPAPTPTVVVSETVAPTPDAAPGTDTGVFVDPASGSLRVDENTGVALGVSLWIAAVVAGLLTAWLVLP